MLTTNGNQYLRPEYLSPLQGGTTIELDAKKSPLALLAQTCSQIGADMPQKTSPLTANEKSHSKGKSSPSKSPATSVGASSEDSKPTSFKPYEKKKEEDDDHGSPISKRTTPGVRSPSGLSSHREEQGRSSSRNSESGRPSSKPHDPPTTSSSSSRDSTRATSPVTPKTCISSSFALHSLASLGDLSSDPLAAYRVPPALYPSFALGLDHLGAAGFSALTAKVPTTSASSSALTGPYIGYAKIKTVSGSEAIVPVCRDPYCSGCQINAHAAQIVSGTCPPACSQCAQISAYTKNFASLPSLIPSLPHSALNGLYPPPGLMGGAQQPYVCNWISPDNYCGKKFATSEELLQHLRSHTSISNTSEPVTSTLPLHALHHPLLSGHLPRGYPTPPLSPLSAAARYHPYAKTPLSHLPPTAPLPSASALSAASLSALSPHPLSAYYSPYSLYARGLGATAGLHP